MSCEVDLTIVKGDTSNFDIHVYNKDGSNFDLSAYNMKLMAKLNIDDDDTDAVIEATAVISAPTSGVGTFDLAPADTRIDVSKYYFDVQIYNSSSGIVITVRSQNILEITKEVKVGLT